MKYFLIVALIGIGVWGFPRFRRWCRHERERHQRERDRIRCGLSPCCDDRLRFEDYFHGGPNRITSRVPVCAKCGARFEAYTKSRWY